MNRTIVAAAIVAVLTVGVMAQSATKALPLDNLCLDGAPIAFKGTISPTLCC